MRPRCCACCCVPRLFSGRRRDRRCWARLLGAPVGGGPPARSPHASLTARSGRSRSPARPRRRPRPPQPGPSVPPPPTAAAARPRLEAWPGPAGAHGRRSQAPSRSLARPLWRRPQISAQTTLVSTSCSIPSARNNSPCVACCLLVCEKIRPAGAKEAKNAVFRCAGRTFSRFCCGVGCAGRTFSRNCCRTGARGEFCTGFGARCGTKFSLLGVVVVDAVQSSPCSGKTG